MNVRLKNMPHEAPRLIAFDPASKRDNFRGRRFILSAACATASTALLLTLTACQSPARQPPVEDLVPAAFSTTGPAATPAQWWQSFNDPTLNALIEQALAGNPSFGVLWDRLEQARAIARREASDLYPALDGEASVDSSTSRTRTNNGTRTDSDTDLSLGVFASWEVDLWGRVRANVDAAERDALTAAQDVQAAAQSLSANVALTWYRLAESDAQLRVLAQQIQTNEQVLELIELRFERGQVEAADVLQQRQLVEARRGQLELERGDNHILRHQLAVLVGRPPRDLVLPTPETLVALPTLPEIPGTGVPSELLQRRPDVLASYHQVMSADRSLAAAVADQYPRLSLSAGASTTASRARDLFDNWLATIAANLAQPLFDAGQRKAEVRRNRAVVSEAIHAYRDTVLIALQEVEDALASEASLRPFMESLARQYGLAAQVLDRTEDRYLAGEFDYLRVLEALTSYQSLEQDLLSAELAVLESRIALYRALAGPLPLQQPELMRLTDARDPDIRDGGGARIE